MLRRMSRIIVVVSGILLVALIATSQWVGFVVNLGRVRVVTHPPFVRLVWGPDSTWDFIASNDVSLREGYFAWPRYQLAGEVKFAILPWWSISVAAMFLLRGS